MSNFDSKPGILTDNSHRLSFRQSFSLKAKAKKLTPYDCALRCILLGVPFCKPFTPISNASKLANGAKPMGALIDTLLSVRRIGLPDEYFTELPSSSRKEICDAIKLSLSGLSYSSFDSWISARFTRGL